MDVLPLVLSEEDVLKMGAQNLVYLRSSCTQLVLSYIKRYLSKPGLNYQCAAIVEKVFATDIFTSNMNRDTELTRAFRKLSSLSAGDITADLSIDELKSYRQMFSVADNVDAIAWLDPKQKTDIENTIAILKEDDNLSYIAKKIEAHKNLFIDKSSKTGTGKNKVGTVYRTYERNTTKFNLIKPGIEFLISMKEKGIDARAWRHL